MLESLFIFNTLPDNAEKGIYQAPLVILSYIVASVASYTALSLTQQMVNSKNVLEQRITHWGGAFAMGAGIWSMHFIAMLAYKMDMYVFYDPFITILSMLAAIMVSYFVLEIIKDERLSVIKILYSAILLGIGICLMHYIGMAAMKFDGNLRYTPGFFILSVLIAISASAAALAIAFVLTRHIKKYQLLYKIIAAAVMGAAICGMHYTGMAAAVFIPWADCRYDPNQNFIGLALSISAITFLVLGIALYLSVKGQSSERILSYSKYHSRYFPVIAILTVGLVISIYSYNVVRKLHGKEVRQNFLEATNALTDRIKEKLSGYEQILVSFSSFYSASDFVSRKEFNIFATSLLKINSDILAFEYVPLVKKENLKSFIREERKEIKNFSLKEYDKLKKIKPLSSEKRDIYFPLQYTEPYEPNADFVGFDFWTSPIHSQAMQKAGTFKTAVSTKPFMLLRGRTSLLSKKDDRTDDIIIFYPFFRDGNTDADWKNEIKGFLEAVVDVGDLLENILRSKSFVDIDITVTDITDSSNVKITDFAFPHKSNETLHDEKIIEVFQRHWKIEYAAKPGGFKREYWQEYLILVGGIGVTLLIAAYFLTLIRQNEKNMLLQEKAEHETKKVKLLNSITVAANEAKDIETVIEKSLSLLCSYAGWPIGHAYMYNPKNGLLESLKIWHGFKEEFKTFKEATEKTILRPGIGLPGQVYENKRPVWCPGVT